MQQQRPGVTRLDRGTTVELLETRALLSSAIQVAWSTYIGGRNDDQSNAVAYDSLGNLFVAGTTTSPDLPHTSARDFFVGTDVPAAYVSKVSPSGAIHWTKYIDTPNAVGGMTVDKNGGIFVIGGGWLTKLSASGDILWTRTVGGYGTLVFDVAIDPVGSIYVAGQAHSVDAPLAGTLAQIGYLAKLDASGALLWSKSIGDLTWDSDCINSIAVDGTQGVVIGGLVNAAQLQNAINEHHGGGADGFVARIRGDGATTWSTYIGQEYNDSVAAVTINSSGQIVATAQLQQAQQGVETQIVVVKLGSDGVELWQTAVVGTGRSDPLCITTARNGDIFVGGETSSTSVVGAENSLHTPDVGHGFVSMLSGTGKVKSALYVGGSGWTYVFAIALDPFGTPVVAGWTRAPDLPMATNAFIPGRSDYYDGFVTKLALARDSSTPLTGTAGNDQIRVASATVMDPSTGQTVSGVRITLNGATGGPLVPDGRLVINGLEGNDTITVDPDVSFPVLIYGAGGNDTIFGGGGNDTIYGNTGDDQITAGEGTNSVLAGLGNDTLSGGSSADTLLGGNGSDLIYGQSGNDYIEGRGKADTLYGGSGNDTIYGGAGSDLIYGNAGDDWIDTGRSPAFRDTVHGGTGSDTARADPAGLLDSIETPILT